MTEAGKLIVRDHHGRFPTHSYFNGCATGGHQAMMEVQRFPQDLRRRGGREPGCGPYE